MQNTSAFLLVLSVVSLPACKSEPLEDNAAHEILMACCRDARDRIASIRDIESENFDTRCGACRRGASKGACESAATRIQSLVKNAYSAEIWPVSCTVMREELAELDLSIPELR